MDRRDFVRRALVLGGGAVLTACGGDSRSTTPAEPSTELDAQIEGPSSLDLSALGTQKEAQFKAVEVEGPVETLEWSLRKGPDDPFGEGIIKLGTGREIRHHFATPGSHTIQLRLSGEGSTSVVKHNLQVHVPEASGSLAGVPLVFIRYEAGVRGDPPRFALARRDGDFDPVTLGTAREWDSNQLSWSPTGQALAVSMGKGPGARGSDIYRYGIRTGELHQITSTTGICWFPSWSPNGEWIAYADDTRTGGEHDSLFLARPDGSETRPVGGDPLDERVWGFYTSWGPDSERVLMGSARFRGLEGRAPRRAAVYRSPASEGTLDRRRLTSEEELDAFHHRNSELLSRYDASEFRGLLQEGEQGVAWSPDGATVALTMVMRDTGQTMLAATGPSRGDPIELIGLRSKHPTWSPDGRHLYFSRQLAPFRSQLVRREVETGAETRLSGEDADDIGPALYG